MHKNYILFFSLIFFHSFFGFSQSRNVSALKAILVVGHQEDGTEKAIQEMDKIADLFVSRGITVSRFYDERAIWSDIVTASKEASFFVYSGHGTTLGENNNYGGLCVKSFVSSSMLMQNLRLKKNAVVLFQSVCGGAGSSAGDDGDIGVAEAKNRVVHYSYPFFNVGASVYYANNFKNGVYTFLDAFLSGKKIREIYLDIAQKWTTIDFEEAYQRDNSKNISIASSKGGGYATRITYTNGVRQEEKILSSKSYDIAYVGKADISIRDLY
jgi:hypothetical protein